MSAIDARDVTKTFRAGWRRRRATHALRGVALNVPRGAIFGLLGPNGAGKLIGRMRPGVWLDSSTAKGPGKRV